MQKLLNQPDAVIFDLDGTLFKTETLLLTAFEQTFQQLRAERLFMGTTPSPDRMIDCLGMLLSDIWSNVVPDASEKMKSRANELLLQFQIEGLNRGEGLLYEDVESILGFLHRQGVRLFIASNGLEGYVAGVVQSKGILPLFEGLYSAGKHQTKSKDDLVGILLSRHSVNSAWMVGDRSSDVSAGKANGLVVIGCDYAGFGKSDELDGSDAVIHSFAQIKDLYLNLVK